MGRLFRAGPCGWMGSSLSILGALSSSQLLGKEKLARLARASSHLSESTRMDTSTKMPCHRSWVPKGRPRHVQRGVQAGNHS